MDGPKLVGEGREAIKVVARFVVDDVASRASGRVVASASAILVVGIWDAMLLVIPVTSLALSSVVFTVAVVDAWVQILLVELEAEVIQIDLLFIVMGSCRVMT
jgi:hypothetical protein